MGRSEKQDGHPGLWLAETFSLLFNRGFKRKLTGNKISTSSIKFVFFGPIGKTRWPPWPLIGWGIFDFSSETAERNSTKLDRKQDLNALYQVFVFQADRKNKMAALTPYWLRHFRLLLWNCWTEFNETWQEARSQSPLPSLYFSGRSEKQDGRPGLWLAETFSTSPLKPLNRIQQNVIGSKISTRSSKFVLWADRKSKMATLASDWLRHFHFSLIAVLNENWQETRSQRPLSSCVFRGRSEIQDGGPGFWLSEAFSTSSLQPLNISTKLDRKQNLNVFYQVCICRDDQKSKMAALPLIGWYIFNFVSQSAERNAHKTWQESKISTFSTTFVFLGPIEDQIWSSLTLIGWDICNFFCVTAERNATKLDLKQDVNVIYQVCVFSNRSKIKDGRPGLLLAEAVSTSSLKPLNRIQLNWTGSKISTCSTKLVLWADRKSKMATLASDWLRHFHFSLIAVLNENWQETRSQRPLSSCVFRGRSEIQDGGPGLWLVEAFSTSLLKPLNGIQRNLTGSKISTPSTKFVFFGPIGKTRWLPWPLIGWDIFDFSSETVERNSTKLDRKQDINALYQVCVFRADRKNKMAALAPYWLRHFRLLLWNRWTEFNETWQEARSQRPLPSLCFSGRSEKQDGCPGPLLAETFLTSLLKPSNGIQRNLTGSKISTPSTKFVFFGPIGKTRWPPWPLIGWDIFDFSSETAERNSAKLDRKQDLKALYQVCIFRADRKNKMAALASDWLRHFRLLLWNRLTEFNKT